MARKRQNRELRGVGEGDKGGCGRRIKVGRDGLAKVIEDRTTLLVASRDDGPNSFTPIAARLASRSLGQATVNRHESNGLFGEVVGWFHAGCRDERKVTLEVIDKAISQIIGFPGAGRAHDDVAKHLVANSRERVAKARFGGIFITAVKDAKQLSQVLQDSLTVPAILFVVVRRKELDVSNEVSQAELHHHIEVLHILAIGTEVIAAHDAIEFFAENVDQDFRTTRGRDLVNGKHGCAKAPGPQPFAVLLVPGLINIEPFFLRQHGQQLLVWVEHAIGDFGYQFAELTSTDSDLHDIAKIFANRGKGHMTGALAIRYQCSETRPDQPRLFQILGPIDAMQFVTLSALLRRSTMLFDADRNALHFDLLQDLVRHVRIDQLATTTRTSGVVVDPRVVDFVGLEGNSLVAWMARLPASLAFAGGTLSGLVRCGIGLGAGIYNVARGWLRGIRRVLFRLGQFVHDFGQLRLQFRHALFQALAIPTSRLFRLGRHEAAITTSSRIAERSVRKSVNGYKA